jgi:hypothetical protein
VAIGVVCRCGKSLSDFTDKQPTLADLLPDQDADLFWEAIETAIREHGAVPETTSAFAVDRMSRMLRQVWQCPACGRLLVLGPDQKYHSFVPEMPNTPRDLLAGGRGANVGS